MQDTDAHTALFLDCDMATLAAPAVVVDAYHRALAEDYRSHLPVAAFQRERRRCLRALLARTQSFLRDVFLERSNAAARANLFPTLRGRVD